MSRVVWKYPLFATDVQPVNIPAGGQILHVAEQHGSLALWALVDPSAATESRLIAICGTGQPAPAAGQHIGTVLLHGGTLVLHVFEPRRA